MSACVPKFSEAAPLAPAVRDNADLALPSREARGAPRRSLEK